jgi:hypothetical protein
LFDHYVFSGARMPPPISPGGRGVLDRLDAEHAGRLRAFIEEFEPMMQGARVCAS